MDNIKEIVKKYKSLSDFIRNATKEDKEIIFKEILQKAIDEQNNVQPK